MLSGKGIVSTTYQSFLLRLLYNPTSKLTFTANGGLQFRQSASSTAGSSASSTAILSAVLGYRFSSKTSLSLRVFRNTDVDAFNSANIMTVTGIEGSLGWQITRRASLDASLQGGNVEQTTLGGAADGSYSFAQGTIALSYVLLQDVNVRVFNSFQQRSRGAEGTNFTSNTSGMSLGARF
ncbi:MAG: transporter [Terrimicrobiaceae bacterium]